MFSRLSQIAQAMILTTNGKLGLVEATRDALNLAVDKESLLNSISTT